MSVTFVPTFVSINHFVSLCKNVFITYIVRMYLPTLNYIIHKEGVSFEVQSYCIEE